MHIGTIPEGSTGSVMSIIWWPDYVHMLVPSAKPVWAELELILARIFQVSFMAKAIPIFELSNEEFTEENLTEEMKDSFKVFDRDKLLR